MAVTRLHAATGTAAWPEALLPQAATTPGEAEFTVSTAGGVLVTLPAELLTTTAEP